MISSPVKKIFFTIFVLLLTGASLFGLWHFAGRKLLPKVKAQTFVDVKPDYWAYLDIEAAYRAGIVSGYPDGLFHPEDKVTNDQMAVFLARAVAGGDSKVPKDPKFCVTPSAGLYSILTGNCKPFKDVPTTYWAYYYIQYLYSKNIAPCAAIGYCYFYPTTQTNRSEMSKYLARAVAGGDSKVPAGPTTPTFKDVPTTYKTYKYIEYLAKMGIVSGYSDGTFHPLELITRAQMCVFINRAFSLSSTALVANISGKVTTNTGVALPNAYLVFNDGEKVIKADAYGNFKISGVDATLTEVTIYDQNGYLYESPNLDTHLISPNWGDQIINFSGLVKK